MGVCVSNSGMGSMKSPQMGPMVENNLAGRVRERGESDAERRRGHEGGGG